MSTRYVLYETGPDNRSACAECWGSARTSRGRALASGERVSDLAAAVDALDHDNWWVRGPGGRTVASSRSEFYAIPSCARAITAARVREAEARS